MRVKAAVARTHGAPLDLVGLDLGEPRAGEMLVRLVASGVSRADRAAIAGTLAMPLPFVPGCEAAGLVEGLGDGVTGFAPGDAVVIGWAACGACESCLGGRPRGCADFNALNLSGRRADGSLPFAEDGSGVHGFFFGQSSFATHVVCRADSAIKVPPGTPLEIVAALGGEMLVGAAEIERLDLAADDALVITGADAVGLFACMVARARGIGTIIVADPDERRCKLALDVGATVAVPADDGLPAVAKSLVADGVRYALDVTGTDDARRACLGSLAPGGTCVLVAAPADPTIAAPEGQDVILRRAGGDMVAADLVPRLLRLQADGRLPLDVLIDFFAFEHVNDALAASASGDVVKAVIRFTLGGFGDLDRALEEGAAADAPENEPEDADPDERERRETTDAPLVSS